MLTLTKVFIILFSLCLWEQGTPWQFKNKSVSSPFIWVSRYILFLVKLNTTGRPFWRIQEAGALSYFPQEHLVVIKDEKVCLFVKLEVILPLLCWLLDSLTNKHCRAWNSMKYWWIDFRTCHKYRILLSARKSSNN